MVEELIMFIEVQLVIYLTHARKVGFFFGIG